jgi:hypothetical protein
MTVSVNLQGLHEVEVAFADFAEFGQRGLALSVVRAGLRAIGEQMQEDMKPQVQHMAAEVGYRFDRKASSTMVAGRVGVGVGKRINRQNVNRGSRGLGITSGNWHWWVLGSFKTGQRFTNRTRANRGILKAQQPNFAQRARDRAAERARSAMQAAMERSTERFFRSK